MKNIPVPSKKLYLKSLVDKTELLIKRMRWKVLFFEQDPEDPEATPRERYGFKTRKCPPQHKDLIPFEEDLMDMIQKVSFKTTNNPFQDTLRHDIDHIKESKDLLIFADKTRNLYDLDRDSYMKLLTNNVTKTYKKANNQVYNDINREAKELASKLDIADKVECMAKTEAFVTLKDHKEDFNSNPKCRLINPAKSEIGKVSKRIIEKINEEVKSLSNVNQWKNTKNVTAWFQDIENKKNCSFTQFDIEEFYPSISKDLLLNSIEYAKQFTSIKQSDIDIVMHARKSILFNDNDLP